ncbi:adenylate/guanylate cyclase domain-containing protein [Rhizobium sp. RCAM05973]|uniref:adenylate/guanylate cyclase domain-containing protein n=1 Tax=Rhizobium sp. RCAM05973 TaxID=2994066 RepID=UPI0022EBFB81|nr:adenylate/guanylate cyclase domain-containing protein [Rhizobium sp. RCAM05973]
MQGMQGLIDWIVAKGLSADDIDDILVGLAERLEEMGYPLLRASIAMPSIDPMRKGFSVSWSRSSTMSIEVQGHDNAGQELFRRSPISYLLSNDLEFGRWKLPSPADQETFPLLQELADLGATDYLMRLIGFPGETALAGVGFSLAVDGPSGFSDEQIAGLDTFLPTLALACYRIAAMRVATDVLAVYTGVRTSGRILNGQTRRGDGTSIYAAIMMADLKDFTSLNERYAPDDIVAWLNEHFEAIAQPVEDAGGEILKFMGDSVLAIFPAEIDNPDDACRRALSATMTVLRTTAQLNSARAIAAKPEMLVDIVLHVGEVFYGNIGASRRLDFTAIGKAVNEAARIEKLCDALDRNLLASEAFVAHVLDAFEMLGTFPLKGVAKPANVYGLISADLPDVSRL